MPLLYYWRHDNYVHDLGQGGAAYHLNQRSARLHRVDIGDSLWATRRCCAPTTTGPCTRATLCSTLLTTPSCSTESGGGLVSMSILVC